MQIDDGNRKLLPEAQEKRGYSDASGRIRFFRQLRLDPGPVRCFLAVELFQIDKNAAPLLVRGGIFSVYLCSLSVKDSTKERFFHFNIFLVLGNVAVTFSNPFVLFHAKVCRNTVCREHFVSSCFVIYIYINIIITVHL